MPDITFTNGSRIFTPSQPPQLGDVNNDGEVDILDAGDVNAFQLTDLNGDGIIDILDASEFLANGPGGIVVIPTTNPPIIDNPDILVKPDLKCPSGQKVTDKLEGPGIVVKVCDDCIGTKLETAVCKACAGVSKGPSHACIAEVEILDFKNAIVTCKEATRCQTCYQCDEQTCGEQGTCSETDWWYIIGGDSCYATELDCYWETCFKYGQFPILGTPEHLGTEGTYYQMGECFSGSLMPIMCDCYEYHNKLK